MTTEADTVPLPDRRLIDADVVRRLIAAQFPQWAGLPVRPVAVSGWDNQTFHLGDTMSVRLPTAHEYSLAVAKEHRWLPVIAAQVPLPIPVPIAQGEPGEGFRFDWSVYEWIDGSPARPGTITDLTAFATDVAGFLVALRQVDPAGAPQPGLHNWFRGGPLARYAPAARHAAGTLGDRIPAAAVAAVLDSALEPTWDGRPVWFHGDIAPGNLLVRDGALAAVIDFGTSGVGDPACDLAIAWTMLTGQSRTAFRDRLGADAGTWARGRGWALWKALILLADAVEDDDPREAAEQHRIITEILHDHAVTGSPPR
ncbi:aminoglycoside phosphotransferase [Actinoplanes italicus]|uniref:Aminoglycoside phosphotransferase (APT) family kinase protein n=1 Tax=Actinoplanes italicus TaxID=113567 RepID=A0A2T0KH34_9ACTN|nr:aminoglycoside phosphotransferase family protein [Actinoplanes italicus]PRX22752.1 aminoglycoside phosphotransferase (APT) family kinase protein [Actinoplanes italicus]GIE28274.1 aminoglycoside phosphotransferase [Actinoplanes italicus]